MKCDSKNLLILETETANMMQIERERDGGGEKSGGGEVLFCRFYLGE